MWSRLAHFQQIAFYNVYGPTECTVDAAIALITPTQSTPVVGRPIANTRIYLLDAHGQPVPLGVAGEMYIGGAGVARGYLHRPDLTAERFLTDPFSTVPNARMYKTGDLARYLPDGNLVFLGRNDHQVKIRGFRIEPGEIEARLTEHPAVREAVVLAREDVTGDKRLVAYIVPTPHEGMDPTEIVATLRTHLNGVLPEYMVPAAFVQLDSFPLTPNGKLDRKALPAPGDDAYARRAFELPQGEIEQTLATIWAELLGIEKISRHDNFFELGGHSLLAVRLMEQLRRRGLGAEVRALFATPTLADLAATLGHHHEVSVPANLIAPHSTAITSAMLPLIDLSQPDIDHIVTQVPGGIANIQDIYSLSPLQDGILFHHLLATDGDPYLLVSQMAFADRPLLDRYLAAVQQVVNRNDILRTAFVWEQLSTPAQVVWRHAPLHVTEVTLDPQAGPASQQLAHRFDPRHHRINLTQAPLLRFAVAQEPDSGRWLVLQLQHHLIGDHSTLEVLNAEVQAFLGGYDNTLPVPQPFRRLVAQARLGISPEEHERFFHTMLADIDEPTLPFGLSDVHRDGSRVDEAHRMLPQPLNDRLRIQARRLGVSLASLCHLAWAQVLARTSGREQVVFGTVLFGRMHAGEGADQAMGLFINTLPLRLDLDDTDVETSVKRTHARLAGLLRHEHASLALAQRCSGVTAPTPLFSALLNYRHNSVPSAVDDTAQGSTNHPLQGIEWLGGEERTNYPITLSIEDFGHALGLTAQVVQPLSPERVCGYMQQALESLLTALETAPRTPVCQLEVLPSDERTLLMETWNQTDAPYPAHQCIHQLFEQQVQRSPEAIALVYEDQSLSYRQLNTQANRLAHHLIDHGVRPGHYVATVLERGIALVIAQLAILKVGAAYVPIDPQAPAARQTWMIADCSARLVLTDAEHKVPANIRTEVLVIETSGGNQTPRPNPQLTLSSDEPAYVMYTSGSTGMPKGVMVPHRAVNRLVINNGYTQLDASARVAFAANPAFDASTFEVWASLLNGGTLIVIDQPTLLSPHAFVRVLQANRVNLMWLTVGLFNQAAAMLAPIFPQLKTLIVGGDALDPAVIAQVLRNNPPQQLINGYGPTETTTFAATYTIKEVEGDSSNIPIGRPIANTRIYLLDAHGQPVPLGVAGEMYIGGAGVARGYLHRPDLTAERFLTDPFSTVPNARMYKTGDLARYLPDGNLVFLGRNDHQVKIRGFRIEPGEIEARLTEHPAVREAVVLAREDVTGDKRLVAYIVPTPHEGMDPTEIVATLRTHLNGVLPEYMVPAAFVQLDSFPLTPNGKLDRKALPAPGDDAYARRAFELPQGEIEQTLATIWAELLGIEKISRHDNFFELGGHSLLAMRLLSRVASAVGVTLPLAALFTHPTLIALTLAIAETVVHTGLQALPAIVPVSREGRLALSFAQQRLWFLAQLDAKISATYHIPMALRLHGPLDLSAWQRSLDTLWARHEALRTVFRVTDGQPHIGLLSPTIGLPLSTHDLQHANDPHTQLRQLCEEEVSTPFDLTRGPLIRVRLVRLAEHEHVFMLTQHHIVSDGWSIGVLIRELSALYTAFVQGHADPLLPLTIQYPDYAAWQRQWLAGERLTTQVDYWRRTLVGAPVLLALPTDRMRPAQQSFAGASVPLQFNAALTQRLKRLSQQHGTTLFMTLMAAWAAMLARLSGQDDLVIGTPTANRNRTEIEPLIGFFVNTLALRIDLSGEPSVADLLARVRHAALTAQDHQDLPFEQVVEIVQPPRHLDHTPLFQVMFVWQNNEAATLDLPQLHVEPVAIAFDQVKFDLELELTENDDGIVGSLRYATALFDDATIERYRGYLLTLLQAMATDSTQTVARIDLLADDERTLLMETWNQTDAPYPAHQCIHQLFEQQVQRSPEAIALVYEDQSLSYRQLNTQANRLAHHLIDHGVRPDDRIALCVERSLAMVIGLLAILKAGAAYVPLDPAYPTDRLTQILHDAQPHLLLSDAAGRDALGQAAITHLTVLDLATPATWAHRPDTNPDPTTLGLTSNHLAYVIYTSGSTGMPKGAQNEHQALINRLSWMQEAYRLSADDIVLQKTPFSFDVSVWEFFWTLLNGATLIIAAPEAHKDARYLIDLIAQHRVTTTHFVPSMLGSFLDTQGVTRCTSLRRVICSGEALTSSNIYKCQHALPNAGLYNLYGPTEAAIDVTAWSCPSDFDATTVPIGRPIANTRIYLLDAHGQPVPLGVAGEMYIGGAGVARGYLHRPDLTAERFLTDPFSTVPNARMYKTGDLARYLPDGNLVFLGRNDHQVKIRGFRIEPGEIEARLTEHPAVREAVVLAREDVTGDKRLVAYIVPTPHEGMDPTEIVATLRTHLNGVLPEYMVPAAFVQLDSFPLTPNGKLDRKALPAPGDDAYARRAFELPQGEIEQTLATIWAELLGIEKISRHDNFFELGGHSLLAVRLMEQLRRRGLGAEVRALFATPTLADLAATLGHHHEVSVPANLIAPHSTAITSAMLPLIDLSQPDIDHIVTQVPGGIANIQDIYSLSPLQDGILFHHLLATDGDPYLLVSQMAFADRPLLDRYLAAVQQVVNRNDILRTAFVWEQLSTPAQVVWRHAPLHVTEVTLDPQAGPASQQLAHRFDPRHHRINLTQAPLLRFAVAQEPDSGRWLVLQLQHHLIGDHSTLEVLNAEVQAFLGGYDNTLPVPQPFRRLVAQARLGISPEEHERFFHTMLADIDEPTLPFGLSDVHRDGSRVDEAHRMLPQPLNDRLRIQARRLGVSLASLCHLAWAQVLARTSGREQVVFGTVLFGRMHAGEGADQAMGLFINTLPLRLDLDDTDVETSVKRTHARLAGLLRHEHASLALAQRCSGVTAPTPLFSALLNYRHNSVPSAVDDTAQGSTNHPLQGIEWLGGEERTNYPCDMSVEDLGHALGLTAQVVQPLSPERVCGYMQQALESLLTALETAPRTPVCQLEVLPSDERTLLMETWNQTDAPYPAHQCIHQLFEQQVQRSPEAIALVYEDQSLSYRQLNTQANRLAHHLIDHGVRPDDRIALCVERSLAMVIGLLAVLKAGAAYVPLDPAYPTDRLTQILHDAQPHLLLSDAAGRDALGQAAITHLTVLDLATPATWAHRPDTNPDPTTLGLTSSHLAYVIYTSGSTGMPKGVMVEHRGVCNQITALQSAYGLTPYDRVLQFASPAFDVSVEEIFGALLSGAALILRTDTWLTSESTFCDLCAAHGITVAELPNAFWGQLAGIKPGTTLPSTLRQIVIGGEAVNIAAVELWFKRKGHRPTLFNAYGPTEITVNATLQKISSGSLWSAIGRPIANTRIYLLDAHGQPVPLGVAGEMYIGGAGVARGYLHRPDLTAERFLTDPFSTVPNARMYKTGDLARYLPDGNLVFLGRNDHQVKIRGFRIEPGEIEARLTEHPAVREAVVLAREDVTGDKRLVAYIVPTPHEGMDPTEIVATLRTHLNGVLPEYMVPAAFVQLDSFPLTPNGKLDRKALPAPGDDAYARRAFELPQGEIEQTLATIWAELLGIEKISRHDNFFELGGHSLLAVRLMEQLRRRGLGAEVRALFATPTLADLAATLGHHHEVSVPANLIAPHSTAITSAMLPLIDLSQPDIDHIVTQVPGGIANIQDIYSLSPLQDGILFHHLLATDGDPYLLVSQMAFADRPLLDRYLAAVQQVVNRNDILRTAFVWEQLSTPAQVVWRHAPLHVTEVTLDPQAGPASQQLAHRFDPRHHRINLTQAPLLRFAVAQEPDSGRWLVLQLQHHLIGDHSTLEVLNAEVQAFLGGYDNTLPVPQPFRRLVAQARLGISPEEHERFFHTMLADIDEPTLPFGLSDVHRDGSRVDEAHRMLPQPLNDRLRIQARRLGVSLASLCHLAWAQVLARTSGREQVVFGTVLFGRMHAGEGADQAMGLFINTLPLRLDLDDTDVETSVKRTHARLAGLLRHEHASLALAQRCSGVTAPTPLFSALLNYRHNSVPSAVDDTAQGSTNHPLQGIEWLGGEERTNYPITLSIEDFGHALGLTAQVVQPLSPERVCGYMQQALESLLTALETAPRTPVCQLEVLPSDERTLLMETWNQTDAPYPAHQCIHQLFEQQVQRSPEAIALVYEDQSLSYRQLNTQANRLAHHLIDHGVRPDDRIALCVERSLAMVIGLLAVLKAGAAYVPLDPAYPTDRLTQILHDAQPHLLLSDTAGRDALGQAAITHLTVLDLATPATWAHRPDTNPDPTTLGLTSSHLAYVIYTSGSTGMPKGVMVEHANVARLFASTEEWLQLTSKDTLTLFHSYSFDFSVWEIWGALFYGGRLIVVPHSTSRSPTDFYRLICREEVTVLNQTPSAFRQLVAAQTTIDTRHQLRKVIFGGEALDLSSVKLWYEQNADSKTQLVNMYGITEVTVHATCCLLNKSDAHFQGGTPIGCRLPDLRIYLLDRHGEPVPVGVAGEIYIGGAGVARGYLNRPELTAERFVRDPYSADTQARMYKTGDLGRWLPDGNIEFLGRNDFQVKIRGFRIELGEIESRLMECAGIREAVVLAREDGEDKRLVAYYVPSEEGVDAQYLRGHLSGHLPEYMVPAAYVRMDGLPLTHNGKLDRKMLPAPESDAYVTRGYEAPEGEIETTLARIWEELLGHEKVGRNDNFFELGGDSIKIIGVVSQAEQEGIHVTVDNIFRHQTIAAIAKQASVPGTVTVRPPANYLSELDIDFLPEGIEDAYSPSRLQMGMVFHNQNQLGMYHDIFSFNLKISAWDLGIFQIVLNAIVEKHPALRTSFDFTNFSEPLQLVHKMASVPVAFFDISMLDEKSQNEAVAEAIESEKENPFDISKAPLLRVFVHYRGDDLLSYTVSFHHAILDGWSVASLQTELLTEYAKLRAEGGDNLKLAPLASSLKSAVNAERHALQSEEARTFWGNYLSGHFPTLLPSRQNNPGNATENNVEFVIESELRDKLAGVATSLNVPLRTILLAGHVRLASVLTDSDDVIIGMVANTRPAEKDGDKVLGLFLNTLPFRQRLDCGSWESLIKNTFQTELEVYPFRSFPYFELYFQNGRTPLFDMVFNYVNFHIYDKLDAIDAIDTLGGSVFEATNFPLTLNAITRGETSWIVWTFDENRLSLDQVQRISGYYLNILEEIAFDTDSAYVGKNHLSNAERQQVLQEWNATERDYPQESCIHELFEAQVAKTPDAVALVYEQEGMSYAQLNIQANRLAHYLRELGVRPDDRVAICVERGLAMVVGLLGILKAGAAYVPLDPGYPAERLSYMLDDSDPVVVLTQDGLDAECTRVMVAAAQSRPVLKLMDASSTWEKYPASNPIGSAVRLSSRHLAYVIYTSGSTGMPKGVMVEHRSLVNHINWQVKQFGFNELDAFLQRTSSTFDASGWEIWTPIAIGARLVLLPIAAQRDIQAIFAIAIQQQVTIIQMVPSFLVTLSNPEIIDIGTLRYLFCGGEPLSRELLVRYQHVAKQGVINLYGPSEATIDATAWQGNEDSVGLTVPIGRPIANTRIYLLDAHGQPVPLGVAGEMYIGGAGVARGYLHRPDLTAERFLTDPFSTVPNARMYKTGDLARYLPDGNLVFLGRNDHQVKIRGFRIEPGEIEARLTEHPAVREAVVLAREDVTGDKRLVAYIVPTPHEGMDPTEIVATLRTHLNGVLPEYMVPAAFVQLDSFPLTPNGKLDRKALPAPGDDAYARRAFELPQGEIEQTLATIWAELLGIEKISRHDNFFELGGHSLLAMQIVIRAKSCGLKLNVNQIFQSPILQNLAKIIAEKPSQLIEINAIPIRTIDGQAPLFFLPSGTGDYSYAFELTRELDVDLPVYALPWQTTHETPFLTMEAMASRMVAMIRVIQPHGPYRLVGYSSGGMLAYAIAQHLLGVDETISFIGLIDVGLPLEKLVQSPTTAKQLVLTQIELIEHFETLHKLADDMSLTQLIEESRQLNPALSNKFHDVQEAVMFWERAAHFNSNIVPSYQVPSLPVMVHQFHAIEVLSLPQERSSHDDETAVSADVGAIATQLPTMGWDRVLPLSSIHLIPIPGDHFTMITVPENRTALGNRLSKALKALPPQNLSRSPSFNSLVPLYGSVDQH
jgi:amino acid adenylation domain-containing protein